MPAKTPRPKKRPSRPSGSAWLKKRGGTAVTVGVPDEALALIDQACAAVSRSRANFFELYAIPAAVAEAKKILENSANNS